MIVLYICNLLVVLRSLIWNPLTGIFNKP
jgi:hypothetical protein